MKILPTSPVTVSTYWTLMAQVAQNLSGEGGEGVAVGAADEYLEALMGRLSQWHGSALPAVAAAGEAMAAAVLGGGKLFPYSGRGEFWSEASGTAGGLMGVYNLEVEVSGGKAELTGELSADDVVILAWVLADPAVETAVARAVKEAGATLIGFFPFERETPKHQATSAVLLVLPNPQRPCWRLCQARMATVRRWPRRKSCATIRSIISRVTCTACSRCRAIPPRSSRPRR